MTVVMSDDETCQDDSCVQDGCGKNHNIRNYRVGCHVLYTSARPSR
jgi:hypothetical protein